MQQIFTSSFSFLIADKKQRCDKILSHRQLCKFLACENLIFLLVEEEIFVAAGVVWPDILDILV